MGYNYITRKSTFKLFKLIFIYILTFNVYSISFKDKLLNAEKGNFIVIEQNKLYSIININYVDKSKIVFEEITVPTKHVKLKNIDWPYLIKSKSLNFTSWSMFEVDLELNQIDKAYSFLKRAWFSFPSDNFFLNLINLNLKFLSYDERKKIGQPPCSEEPDLRKQWKPVKIVNGSIIKDADFDVFSAVWPKDKSNLSEKTLELYFDKEANFPFPYWTHIYDGNLNFKIKVVDSGNNMISPYTGIPKRSPEFIGFDKKKDSILRLKIKNISDIDKFLLYAVDITSKTGKNFLINFELKKTDEKYIYHIDIENKHLETILNKNKKYIWTLIPENHPNLLVESEFFFKL